MQSIPADKNRGWKVKINGDLQVVNHLEVSSDYGTLEYGLRPEGYDCWVFHQAKAGVITLPYCNHPDHGLMVGLVEEKRPNVFPNPCLCILGGFAERDESPEDAQARESYEEGGVDSTKAVMLEGIPSNSNRLFFVTREGEGNIAYKLQVPHGWLIPRDAGGFTLPSQHLLFGGKKKESDIVFLPWKEAVRKSPDALARAAIAQLLASL